MQRWLHFPRLLGWSVVGALLGPHMLGMPDVVALDAMAPLLDIAAGVVLFELGQRVDPTWLRRNPWLLGTSVLESAFGFAAMYAVLTAVGAPPLIAAVAAAIGISTVPTRPLARICSLISRPTRCSSASPAARLMDQPASMQGSTKNVYRPILRPPR